MSDLRLEELSATYSQSGDNTGGEDFQDLEIKTQDGGGGIFYVIQTERWAFENIKELEAIIKDFEKRVNMKIKIKEK